MVTCKIRNHRQSLLESAVLYSLKSCVANDPGNLLLQAAGLLIGLEDLSEEKQLKFVSALLLPLCSQVMSDLGCLVLCSRPPS
jgi:hypothetical protein